MSKQRWPKRLTEAQQGALIAELRIMDAAMRPVTQEEALSMAVFLKKTAIALTDIVTDRAGWFAVGQKIKCQADPDFTYTLVAFDDEQGRWLMTAKHDGGNSELDVDTPFAYQGDMLDWRLVGRDDDVSISAR